MLAGLLITKAIQAAVTAFDNWIHRVEKANEAMNEAVGEYESAKSSLDSINSELEEQNKQIDDLLAKDKLTYAEKGQLEELQAITKELLLQQDIEERRAETASREVADKAVDAYNKQYKRYGSSREDLNKKLSYENFYLPEDEDDVLGNIAAYVKATESLTKVQKEYQNALKNGEDTTWLADDVQYSIDSVNDLSQALDDNLSDLQEKRLALESEYNKAIEKRQKDIEPLTSSEQDIITTYESIYDTMKMVYEYTNQNDWNDMEIENIFNTEGIEKTKEELAEMAKSGELTPETIASYKNLNAAIQNSEIFLKNGQTAAEAFCEQINALNDALNYDEIERQFRESLGIRDGEINGASDQKIWNEIKDSFSEDEWQIALEAYLTVKDQYGEHPEGWNAKDWISHIQSELETEIIEVDTQLSISQTVDQLNTQLKPAFDSLQSAYQDIFTDDGFTLENVGVDMLNSIKSSIDELNSMEGVDINIDSSAFEEFARVLSNTSSTVDDVKNQFDQLSNTIVRSTSCTEVNSETFDVLTKSLEEMGLVNAREVLEEIIEAQEEFIAVSEQLGLTLEEVANATYEETVQMLIEAQAAGQDTQALWQLAVAQGTITDGTIATESNVDALLAEAQAAGFDAAMLTALENVRNGNIKDTNAAQAILEQTRKELQESMSSFKLDFDFSPAVKSAKKAGKDSGKSYKDALKEELSDLESVISGITGKIDDQISSINSQKSAALSSIDEQKEALEEAKDAALTAIEAERDARLEVVEAQRKQIEQNIKAKQKVIDGINEEIKSMRDANDERKRQNDLMKAQYELEKLQHQRTILQYSEDRGMHYVTDTKDIRSKKQVVDDAKLEIDIANKEKEIDLIEKEIDLLNEKLDLLDEQEDEINAYYDKLISETERFYDQQLKSLEKQRKETESYFESLIKNLETSKSKYQELTEILEKAEFSAKLKQLGIDEEALLAGSEEEFEKLKNAYMNIVFQLNEGNDEVLNSLRELSGYDGTAPAMLSESSNELDTMNGKLDESNQSVGNVNNSLTDTASKTSDVASNVSNLESNLTNVNSLVTEEQTAFSNLLQTINEVITAITLKTEAIQEEQNAVGIATSSEMADFLLLKEKILEVKETLDTISGTIDTLDTTPVDNLTESFQSLYEKILLVSTTLGAGMEGQGEGVTNSITSAIQALNEISFEEGIIAQFTNLKTAIDSVSSAISGGGGESSGVESQGGNSGSGKGGESGGKGSNGEGGGNSLTGAITEMGDTTNEIIGEPDAEGDGTVIGEFGSMKTAVNDVTTAIGGGDSEGGGGQGKGDGDSGNLIGSIVDLGETTEETLGEPDGEGVTGRFGQFRDVIEEANEQVHGIADGLAAIDGQTVECTIKVNIETTGGIPAYASGTALGAMNLESAEYNAKYEGNAHVSGTANVTGNWGVKKPGKSLVGELGQELWVHSADGTFETVGDNGPEWINTAKGDLIFNHLQTKELLDKGNIVKTGKAYANGTIQYSDGTIIRPDGSTLRPLQQGDKGWDLLQKFQPLVDRMLSGEEVIVSNAVFEGQQQMEKMVRNITNNTAINNISNNRNIQQPVTINQNVTINCPNVTNDSGVENIQKQLGHLSQKAYQVTLRDY